MNKKEVDKLYWHPAFYAGLQIEFDEESHKLTFENEHHLSKKPMQIDVLIIKKCTEDKIHKNIGRIFRKYNIIEYKSPDDYISIDDFYKVCAYAFFYKSESKEIDAIKVYELTITFVSMGFPEKLEEHLKEILGLGIEKRGEGIYYITKGIIPMQIIVSSELSEKENIWLRSLTNNLNDAKLVDKISGIYSKHQKDERYKSVMNVIVRANREKFKEVTDMCEALREIWAEDFERARSEGLKAGMEEGIREGKKVGIKEGIKEGIRRMIISSKELGVAPERVKEMLIKNYEVTDLEAEEYIKLYW